MKSELRVVYCPECLVGFSSVMAFAVATQCKNCGSHGMRFLSGTREDMENCIRMKKLTISSLDEVENAIESADAWEAVQGGHNLIPHYEARARQLEERITELTHQLKIWDLYT